MVTMVTVPWFACYMLVDVQAQMQSILMSTYALNEHDLHVSVRSSTRMLQKLSYDTDTMEHTLTKQTLNFFML